MNTILWMTLWASAVIAETVNLILLRRARYWLR